MVHFLIGHGVYRWPDGRVYEGNWERSRQHGQGEFRWPDGRVYRGQYKDGKMHGSGILEWPDGRKYDGQWRNGLQSGKGKYWACPEEYREGIHYLLTYLNLCQYIIFVLLCQKTAQFLDGVRVRWLGELVREKPDETPCEEGS